MANATMTEMIAHVRAYALDHYEQGGWDYVVEAFDDAELAEAIGKARTLDGAVRKVAWHARLLGDRRADIAATADW